jgi:DNA-binding transcriptional ArsR family regulator
VEHKDGVALAFDNIDEREIENFIIDVADFFKVFGDGSRIKILVLLLGGEMCVNDIAERLDMSQSAVSHQLRVLRQNDLVKYRKDGKIVFYSLDDSHVENVIKQGIEHIRHKKRY